VASRRPHCCFVDLDGFKLVNDMHGHIGGDALLQQAAGRLRDVLTGDERVARLAGDEFVLMCPRLTTADATRGVDLARSVIQVLSRPFLVGGEAVRLSASVGIAYADRTGVTATQLIAQADEAMYSAKRNGKSRWATYSERTGTAAREVSRVEQLIRTALDTDTLEVCYQPLYTLRDRRIVGVEALARLPDGNGGQVSPAQFIPVAERAGLISRVGAAVLEAAAGQAACWKRGLGEREFGLGVNLSVRELGDPGLLQRVTSALDRAGLDPSALVLELTETVFSDSDTHREVLREHGVKLFIEDFGTGYSSLSYLRRFTVDGLKIDRSFVADLVDPRDRRVTRAIVSMALDLGVPVVAEGIETEQQRAAGRAGGASSSRWPVRPGLRRRPGRPAGPRTARVQEVAGRVTAGRSSQRPPSTRNTPHGQPFTKMPPACASSSSSPPIRKMITAIASALQGIPKRGSCVARIAPIPIARIVVAVKSARMVPLSTVVVATPQAVTIRPGTHRPPLGPPAIELTR